MPPVLNDLSENKFMSTSELTLQFLSLNLPIHCDPQYNGACHSLLPLQAGGAHCCLSHGADGAAVMVSAPTQFPENPLPLTTTAMS